MRILVSAVLLLSSMALFAGDKVTDIFTLDHQMSQHCEKKIKDNLRFEKGVTKIDVSLKDNTIAVTFDEDKTNPEKIIEGFKKIGFTAFLIDPEKEDAPVEATDSCCK